MAITESRSLPPQFVEDLGKDYATQLTGLTSQPLDTTKFQPMVAGQDQAQTDAYNLATQQGKGIGAYAPYLSQAGAYQTGTGSFAGQPTNMMGAQDYLNAAQNQSGIAQTQIGQALAQSQAAGTQLGAARSQLGTSRGQIGNLQAQSAAQGALSGPNAYQQFMSPYQQDVIDASLAKFDQQSAAGMTGIGQSAAMSGNLGGGREGVMKGQYQSDSDMNRALLESGLLQQGFGQAQNQANTAFGQQGQLYGNQQGIFNNQQQLFGGEQQLFGDEQQLFGNEQNMFNNQQQLFSNQNQLMAGANQLGADQQRMASLVPGLYGQDVATLGQAGTNQQLQEQNILDQQREANRLAAYEPYERLGYMGAGMGNVMGGAMGQYNSQITPNKSPLETALGIASLGYGMTQ
jgi:hypothetical protein